MKELPFAGRTIALAAAPVRRTEIRFDVESRKAGYGLNRPVPRFTGARRRTRRSLLLRNVGDPLARTDSDEKG